MTDLEAVEYRQRSLSMLIVSAISLGLLVGGLTVGQVGKVLVAMGEPGQAFGTYIMAVIMFGVAVVFQSRVFASIWRGYNRAFWAWVGDGFDTPPLEEWSESLKDRDEMTLGGGRYE